MMRLRNTQMTETDTFSALKFGTFTADDIKQRWITGDNSKFVSLPNEVKVQWLELLRDRHKSLVSSDMQDTFLKSVNSCIEKARNGNYAFSIPFYSSFYLFSFSSFVSFTSFSTSFSTCVHYFTDDVINELATDAGILNDIIKEHVNERG